MRIHIIFSKLKISLQYFQLLSNWSTYPIVDGLIVIKFFVFVLLTIF